MKNEALKNDKPIPMEISANQRLFREFIEVSMILLNIIEPRQLEHAAKVAALVYDYLTSTKDAFAPEMYFGSLFHDIGAISISSDSVHVSEAQSSELHRQHPVTGANIIKYIPGLEAVREAIEHHHENYDGSGYPNGKRGPQICYHAQIIKLADTLEFLTRKDPDLSQGKIDDIFLTTMHNMVEPNLELSFLNTLNRNGIRKILAGIDPFTSVVEQTNQINFTALDVFADDITGKILSALAKIIDAKHHYTAGHSDRVTKYCLMIAEELELSHQETTRLKWASLIHDAGKVAVPSDILNKPGRLTEAEFAAIKQHPIDSAKIISPFREFTGLVSPVLFHHERIDGNGYPEGLQDKEIPILAKIICVADAYDAITSDRPYQASRSPKQGLKILRECSGSQFDPEVVNAACRALS